MNLKERLFEQCAAFVDHRARTVENTLESHQKALTSETKSSAGDKHETGRAMLQLEMEKASQQMESIRQMKDTLSKINISSQSSVVCLGTLIATNLGNYFLSISAGQLNVGNKTYFAISTSSPIGQLLLGKKEGDELSWNEKKIEINRIE